MRATALFMLLSAAACLAASSGFAATTAYAVGQGSPNNIPLAIPVTASVTTSCGFATAPNDTYFAPNLDQGFSHDTAFVLQCTTPLRVAIVSSNGGLLTAGAAPSGYTALAPYNVSVNIVGDGGVTANGACAAATLKASAGSPCAFRGPSSAAQGLKLNAPSNNQAGSYVRISAPIYAGSSTLIASTGYADTLTVTLSVSP